MKSCCRPWLPRYEKREEVKAWRDADYAGASATSRALLAWWFDTDT
jgi:hypothetical protein